MSKIVAPSKSRLMLFTLMLLVVASFSSALAQESGIVLRLSKWAQGGFIDENYQRFADEFVAMHPEIERIEFEFQPFVRYHDVLNVQLAAGDPPDLGWLNALYFPSYVQGGHLVEIGETLRSSEDYEFEDINQRSLDIYSDGSYSDGDPLYGIPWTNSTNVMFVNLDMFEAAGLPNPEEAVANDEWTWEYVQQAAKQIVDSGAGRYGFVFGNDLSANGWRILEDIFAPYGALPWSEDGTTCLFNSPEAIEAVSLVHRMMYEDGSHPEPGTPADFFAGDVAMMLGRPLRAASLEGAPYDWTIVRQPSGPAGYHPTIGHASLVVFAAGEHADLATELVAYITNRENSIVMGNNNPSPRVSTQTLELLASANPILTAAQIENAILPTLMSPEASWGYSHRFYGPVESNAQLVFDGEIWRADADVATALNNVCANIQPLLG